nr:dynein regulatory complex protein 8 isoform X3 [Symphalangus syndactylus]
MLQCLYSATLFLVFQTILRDVVSLCPHPDLILNCGCHYPHVLWEGPGKREIGTIIRSLGCCPTEGELHDLIAEVEEEEPTGYIRFEKFLPVMTEILLERKYRPIPEDVLLRAFEVLDSAKRGFLTKDELIKYMTDEDPEFQQDSQHQSV